MPRRKKAADGFDDIITGLQHLPAVRALVVVSKGKREQAHHVQPGARELRSAISIIPAESQYERDLHEARVNTNYLARLGGINQLARARASEARRKGPAVDPQKLLSQLEQYRAKNPAATDKDFWSEHYPDWPDVKFRQVLSRARKARRLD